MCCIVRASTLCGVGYIIFVVGMLTRATHEFQHDIMAESLFACGFAVIPFILSLSIFLRQSMDIVFFFTSLVLTK